MHKRSLTNLFCFYILKTVKQQESAVFTNAIYTKKQRKKVFALSVQEIEALFNNIRKILAMLDKIYHAVEGSNKPEE